MIVKIIKTILCNSEWDSAWYLVLICINHNSTTINNKMALSDKVVNELMLKFREPNIPNIPCIIRLKQQLWQSKLASDRQAVLLGSAMTVETHKGSKTGPLVSGNVGISRLKSLTLFLGQ